jgi:hypothetical protein
VKLAIYHLLTLMRPMDSDLYGSYAWRIRTGVV